MQGFHVAISTHRVATRDEEEVGCSRKNDFPLRTRCCAIPSGALVVEVLALLVVSAGRGEGAGEIIPTGYMYIQMHLHDS